MWIGALLDTLCHLNSQLLLEGNCLCLSYHLTRDETFKMSQTEENASKQLIHKE